MKRELAEDVASLAAEVVRLHAELAAKEAEVEKAIGEMVIEVGRRMTAERELAECRAAAQEGAADG